MKIIFSKIFTLLLFFYIFIPSQSAQIEKDLLYNKHTLKDTYKYKKIERTFRKDIISNYLDQITQFETKYSAFGTLRNYKNANGHPTLPGHHFIKTYTFKDINRVITISEDAYGIRAYQGIPLYKPLKLDVPDRLGTDGELVAIISKGDIYTKVAFLDLPGEWLIPNRYVRELEVTDFKRVVFVDRKNQNISTLEDVNHIWKIRSYNPCTTGLHNPPFQFETPGGIFVVQYKKPKMLYLVDGSKTELAGYTPYATRFSGGGYLHGVPVNLPETKMIEYSPTLGTIPRSHMCVRNATSHAKFIYDWAQTFKTLVIVF
ncbi:L,D-transpeptidase [uncultured Cetobacterium sp.]|uniref:L,D-transpeptidase n=1 Tax=uncultured Cetobacterium sp. TaxID=527638 RepID=UPI002601FC79|nr:L,D-transpeptidase [uncultured Cetobacterium sp.]